MFRKFGKALFALALVVLVFAAIFPAYILGDGQVLVSWDQDSRLVTFIRGPGIAYEPGVFLFWERSVRKEELSSLSEEIEVKYDLASGLFPEGSEEGLLLGKMEVVFSLEGEGAKRWYSATGGKSRSKYLAGIFLSALRSRIEDVKDLNITQDRISNYFRNEAGPQILTENPWLKIESVRIIKLQTPDPIVISNILRNPNFILTKKLERIEALKKAEFFQLEEEGKLRVAQKRWEAYKDYLKKNPDMKEFVLYESLSDKVEVILLPMESILGNPMAFRKKNQSTKKSKEVE
ncbi:hypothetical protein CH373_04615 [Leptospira perolatii]|uniref:Band 7 domain-containing protein n=1 Tax=Leptospira perolatii TaxID=2023191 RepID=A0A2M9ZQ48_9LEPT|nr:hypothetical protein [Leptospira perolatii]PJZ68052.1 hypothetical protein CH360_18200 [Leptospira perolatii]PJZ74200.1 hypothetical protein CH373_04615 [Leptospira perolatii]